ncbi:hypothetical protein GALMADRAFT_244546 [Galerina marginata CBS 339.88]|uniref:Uncharacterized protein n=1 Tax=Galerina marginata (strain CBS 339.88) TaxID=685588 RepID=A0A067TG70_GALM3|nr:hypothetical protein GALMADRAFT_244546 [Galerina marginata CBS 339.88]
MAILILLLSFLFLPISCYLFAAHRKAVKLYHSTHRGLLAEALFGKKSRWSW